MMIQRTYYDKNIYQMGLYLIHNILLLYCTNRNIHIKFIVSINRIIMYGNYNNIILKRWITTQSENKMTNLITESTMKMLQEYDESIINGRFNPFAFYQIPLLSSLSLGESIENKEYKNSLYRKLYRLLENEDIKGAREIIYKLRIEIDQDRGLINKFLEIQRVEEEKEEDIVMQIWNKERWSICSYYNDEL